MAKHQAPDEKYVGYGRFPKRQAAPTLYRIKYSVSEPFRYASHLDVTRTIYRALRRSDLPIQFTQGYSPIPKVSFCPPKSVGQIAKGDFFDLYLEGDYFGNISRELNSRFPSGIRILEVRGLPGNTPSLSTSINLVFYEVTLPTPEIVRSMEPAALKAASVTTRSGAKNLAESIESMSPGESTLSCGLYFGPGKINIYDLLAYLTDRPAESVRAYKVTRTSLFIKKEGILLSPMEVK
jgi:radical SAM-linked protein